MRASDYIAISEKIRSRELKLQGELSEINSKISSLYTRIDSLESEFEILQMELNEALSETDEDGNVDMGVVGAIRSRMSVVRSQISSCQSEVSIHESEKQKVESELQSVETEKQTTLSDIQSAATVKSQNMSKLAGGLSGDYASIGQNLQNAFQVSLGQLSQAASILGGSISAGTGGGFTGASSSSKNRKPPLSSNIAAVGGTGSKKQVSVNDPEMSMNPVSMTTLDKRNGVLSSTTSKGLTAKHGSRGQFHSEPKKIHNGSNPIGEMQSTTSGINSMSTMVSELTAKEITPFPKSISHDISSSAKSHVFSVESSMFNSRHQFSQIESHFHSKDIASVATKPSISSALDRISNAFGRNSNKTFSGCNAKRNPYKKDVWDIVGLGYDKFCEYRANLGNYTVDSSRYGNGIIKEVDVNFIEGIPSITTNEINNPQLFWGRESGKTMESFIEIALHIPEVKEKLSQGYKIEDLRNDPTLGSCVSIYFDPDSPSAPTLYKGDGFYEFVANGRHRILAARYLGYSFPMRVVGEIVSKNPSPTESKKRFVEQLRSGNFISHNTKAAISDIRHSTSNKELSMIAQYHKVSSNINFGKLDLKVSQQIVESLVMTKSIFPNLDINLSFVGSIQARNEHAVKNATQKLLAHYTAVYKKNNPSASRDKCRSYAVFQTKQKLSRLVPRNNTIAQSISIPASAGPVSESDRIIIEAVQGIAINESFGHSDSMFRKQKVEEVMSGHKPHGCNTAKATIDHEIGHQVANALNAADDYYIKQEFEKFVNLPRSEQATMLSTYAGEDHKIGEFLAECWSEYQNNPECRPLAQSISTRMIDIYNAINGYTPKKSAGFDRDEPIRELQERG